MAIIVAAFLSSPAKAATPYISLSITQATGSQDSTSGNIIINTPNNGGVATGRHLLQLSTNAANGYNITLASTVTNSNLATNTSQQTIASTTATAGEPAVLGNNQWGVALPGSGAFGNASSYATDANQATLLAAKFAAIPAKNDTAMTIMSADTAPTGAVSRDVYYGVRTTNTTRAATYTASVTYTATALLPPPPTITSISPDSYKLDATIKPNSSTMTITGNHLATTDAVYIDINDNGKQDDGEGCTNIAASGDTAVSCTIPTTSVTAAGKHKVYLFAQGGDTASDQTHQFSYYKMKQVCNDDANICVDYDQNMIPVKYVGDSTTAKWQVVTDAELKSSTDNWWNYSNKKWANAVTVKADKLATYLAAETKENSNVRVAEDDILGYWVYIPRYAYEVMRYQATDKVVQAENFQIHFEKATDTKKIPAASCNPVTITNASQMWANGTSGTDIRTQNGKGTSAAILTKDYRTGCGISRTYGAATGTTWATHPAFSYGGQELNGFWIGKFELTGSTTKPTIKPNRTANVSTYFGDFYDAIKSIGVQDDDNVGGNNFAAAAKGAVQNSHSLTLYGASMLKNDQWGAAAYLSASSYGAGVSGVYNNASRGEVAYRDDNGLYQLAVDDDGQVIDSCYWNKKYYSSTLGYVTSSAVNVPCFVDANGKETNKDGVKLNPGYDYTYTKDAAGNTATEHASIYHYGGSRTGCGPNSTTGGINGASANNYDGCDNSHSYQGTLGVMASTTNNVYGVYDMAGGVWEYVAGNLTPTDNVSTSNGSWLKTAITGRYANFYPKSAGFDTVTNWNAEGSGHQAAWTSPYTAQPPTYRPYFYNNDFCTWASCGGQALHETKRLQSVDDWLRSWGNDSSNFATADTTWLVRGGRLGDGSSAGVFASYANGGWFGVGIGSRAALAGH